MDLKAATLCVIAVVMVSGVFSQKEEPPRITFPGGNKWNFKIDHVRENNMKVIHCQASGNPQPKYTWLKDGGQLPPQDSKNPKLIVNPDTGDLNITSVFTSNENGIYQCVATNSKGKASTPPLDLRLATVTPFSGSTEVVNNKNVFVSDYLKLECKNVPRSEPALAFSWDKEPTGTGTTVSEKIVANERLVIDPQGTLHFLWLTPEDGNLLYVCVGENTILNVLVQNTEKDRLTVSSKGLSDREPALEYHEDVVVMAGQTAQLVCIFTYFSTSGQTLKIEWYLRGQIQNTMGRILTIPNVQVPNITHSQEGEYLCEAKLGTKKTQGKVNLKIVAPPQFLPGEKLTGTTAALGNDAVFHCGTRNHNAHSTPPSWFLNTEPIVGCPPFMFECTALKADGSPKCIPANRQCDNFQDCPDNSDEQICSGKITCNEGMVLCNDVCIATGAPCTTNACEYPNFTCRDKTGCLLGGQVCDGKNDCKDGSDEKACPNGDPITVQRRFRLNSQRTELVVPSVLLSDSFCFQCMVANEYGTAFSDGCLTVIDKIKILYGPNATYEVEPGTFLNIGVDATTDPQYQKQMKFEWLMYDTDTNEKETVIVSLPPTDGSRIAQYFTRSLKNLTIMIPSVRDDDAESYNDYNTMIDRKYAANISHEYDEVILNFTINGKKVVPPVVEPIVESASSNLWIIALILAIIILFVVVILIVCYMHRNRGGTYPLDKKEHQAGHDPEQELKDSGFNDVGRVDDDYDKPKEDEVSLSDSVKPYESDEDITEEYGGDFDMSKFNEDGSFIGQYGEKKGGAKEVTV